MKKLTKTEMKEIEQAKREREIKRHRLVEAVKSFWRDCEAMERVAKINGEHYDKEASSDKALERYEELKFLFDEKKTEYKNDVDKWGKQQHTRYWKMWSWIRILNKSTEESKKSKNIKSDYNFKTSSYDTTELDVLPKNAIWCDDIIWDTFELKLYLELCKEYGIDTIYYTNSSTGALGNISDLTRFGAVIIGTTNISEYRTNEGLVFDISNCILEDQKQAKETSEKE